MNEPSSKIAAPGTRELFHDINGKLGLIQLTLGLIEDEANLGDQGRSHVKTAQEAAQDLKELINALNNALKVHESRNGSKSA